MCVCVGGIVGTVSAEEVRQVQLDIATAEIKLTGPSLGVLMYEHFSLYPFLFFILSLPFPFSSSTNKENLYLCETQWGPLFV